MAIRFDYSANSFYFIYLKSGYPSYGSQYATETSAAYNGAGILHKKASFYFRDSFLVFIIIIAVSTINITLKLVTILSIVIIMF